MTGNAVNFQRENNCLFLAILDKNFIHESPLFIDSLLLEL